MSKLCNRYKGFVVKILLLIFFISSLFAGSLKMPIASFNASGGVRDIVFTENKLYSATDAGCVDIFDINTKDMLSKIEVEKITDFMGDKIEAKIYSVDVLKEKVLILSQGNSGFAQVYIHSDNKTKLLIASSEMLSIAKAKFIDENTLLLALLSNELISYDIDKKAINYQFQVSQSKFSNFALNEKKDEVVVADESGALKIYSLKDAKLLKTLKGQNLDNVFQVQNKNSIIVTAGQDRRVVVYNQKTGSAYYKTSGFLVYSVGLSPSANLVAFSSDEHNNITLFERQTQKELTRYGGNKMTPTNILFLNEDEFLVSSDDKVINLYKIK
ncbi:MAG: WD40 repeat domain-containing protein [Sulfurimonas sp.]|nr:WD40 repeat domain-containing protein [Sulfurimonas sp.]MBU3939927.1 WD40 repeat domain-containing protein [bacterium]MBU4023726.1 WD40 repeat domain-containing protein [bacterium]MBU4058964.1 WD40 repeat domain-containing protein [bacterium]MBU4109988.1 WD40 repeat domain-containing protein [bacterium]